MALLDFFKKLFARRTSAPNVEDAADSAPGWDAIDGAVQPLYPGQEPRHWGTIIKWMLGGRDPLDGISAYRADGPPPHWHFVSYGMTELYAKDSEDSERSGWGFEFTFRLARNPEGEEPPMWAVNLLQNVGRYVFDSGNTLGHGHYLDANGPIAQSVSTDLVALLFLRDPQLPPIDTPHGSVEFLQVIGITADEYAACRAWNSEGFAQVMRQSNPLLITDLHRKSILNDPDVARQVAEGQARDGSSSEALNVDSLRWRQENDRWIIEMAATAFGAIPLYVRGRLDHGRHLAIVGSEQAVVFKPDAGNSVSSEDEILMITLSPESVRALAETAAEKRGTYVLPGLDVTFDVHAAQIRDQQGNVVREVG